MQTTACLEASRTVTISCLDQAQASRACDKRAPLLLYSLQCLMRCLIRRIITCTPCARLAFLVNLHASMLRKRWFA